MKAKENEFLKEPGCTHVRAKVRNLLENVSALCITAACGQQSAFLSVYLRQNERIIAFGDAIRCAGPISGQ